MLWVIQKDVHARNQSYDLIEALERLNIDYIEVEVAKNKIKPDVEGCDDNVLEVVKDAISRWQPARAFVLDTYISGDEIGIVEIGCICHAGIYNADLMKLVVALNSMEIEMTVENKEKRKLNFK